MDAVRPPAEAAVTDGLWRPLVAAVAGAAVFFGLTAVVVAIPGVEPRGAHVILKLALIVLVLVIAASRGRWRELGFRRAPLLRGWGRPYAIGCLVMVVSTAVMIVIGASHPMASKLSLRQVALEVWLLSSVAEELFVRGLVQHWCNPPGTTLAQQRDLRGPVIASALLFGAMHAPLIWRGAGVVGGLILVATTTIVGYVAASMRQRSGSVHPAIALHVAANVCAIPGTMLGIAMVWLLTGELPALAR